MGGGGGVYGRDHDHPTFLQDHFFNTYINQEAHGDFLQINGPPIYSSSGALEYSTTPAYSRQCLCIYIQVNLLKP